MSAALHALLDQRLSAKAAGVEIPLLADTAIGP